MKLNMAENVDFEVSEHWLNTYVAGQFATPTGYGGELTAAIMRIINWLPTVPHCAGFPYAEKIMSLKSVSVRGRD